MNINYKNLFFTILFISAIFAVFVSLDQVSKTMLSFNKLNLAQVSSTTNNLPELPRVYVDTTMPTQTGQTITVNAGGNLQQAINSAQPGDTIVLQAGATFTGNFTLPNKNSTGKWIVIKSSQESSLPPSGKRVFPSNSVNMPKIVSINPGKAIVADKGASYYRFVGIEITDDGKSNSYGPTLPSGGKGGFSYGLVDLGSLGRDTQVSDMPHHIIFDRSYIHGQPTTHIKFGVSMNGAHLAVVDSYLSEFHGVQQDAQAINGYNGFGPFKIVNNHLEGAGENILFGGADPSIPGAIARDVEIRGNYFYKPTSWMLNDPNNPFQPNPNYIGIPWLVKNIVELKQGERFLIEGNVFENNWAHGQTGLAILIKQENQGMGQAGAHITTRDIAFRYNIIKGAAQGATMAGITAPPGLKTNRYLFEHNVWIDIDQKKWTNYSYADCCAGLVQILSDADNTIFRHNTGLQKHGNFLSAAGSSNDGVVVSDNIVNHGLYGIADIIPTAIPGANITNNVIIGTKLDLTKYPGNFNSVDTASVGFVGGANPVNVSDFALLSTSPFKGRATNGTDPGADIATVLSLTKNAISGSGHPPFGPALAPVLTPTPLPPSTPTPLPPSTPTPLPPSTPTPTPTPETPTPTPIPTPTPETPTPTPIPTPTPEIPTVKFQLGDVVKTATILNVRSSPGGTLMGTQQSGAYGTVTSGPTKAEDNTWWNVNFNSGVDGWVAETFIEKSVAPSPTPTPIPTPTPTPTPTPEIPTPTPEIPTPTPEIPTPTPTPVPEESIPDPSFSIGNWIQVTERLSVRTSPTIFSRRLGSQFVGAKGKIVSGPISANGYTWWNIDYTNQPDGWSAGGFFTKTTPPTESSSPSVPSAISVGSRRTTTTTLSVRREPSIYSNRIGYQRAGSSGLVLAGPRSANGYTWWNVNFDSGPDGWVAGEFLR